MIDKHSTKTIANNIKNSLTRSKIKCDVKCVNFNSCIRITSTRDLFIWIRLYSKDGINCIADINNIILPEENRGKHVFTNLFERLIRCKYISEIRITSVCSETMKNWCENHNLNKIGDCDYSLKA